MFGLIGIGTVGGGTWTVLKRNAEEIPPRRPASPHHRRGRPRTWNSPDGSPARRAPSPTMPSPWSMIEIDIIVELIGGYGVAGRWSSGHRQRQAYVVCQQGAAGGPWRDFHRRPEQRGVMVAFEAAVAGESPSSRRCGASPPTASEWAAGIINSTCFIPFRNARQGLSFARRYWPRPAPAVTPRPTHLRLPRRRRRPQGHPHRRHRLRHSVTVRQGLRRGHHQARSGRHQIRQTRGVPHLLPASTPPRQRRARHPP